MKMLIIPQDRVEKIKSIEFQKPHKLEPVKGEIDGREIYFLQADLKDNPIFEKALADFEICEVKDIETIETKYFDSKSVEITDISKIDLSTATCKTILTTAKIIADENIIK